MNPDFTDRNYTTEVMRVKADTDSVFQTILGLTHNPEVIVESGEDEYSPVTVCHAYIATTHDYHRFPKKIIRDDDEIFIPRTRTIGSKTHNLYDIYIAHHKKHVVVSVPFHDLAAAFFLQIDGALARKKSYEKLDISRIVINLGLLGTTSIAVPSSSDTFTLSITRCHLNYSDAENRSTDIQKVRMIGSNLGTTKEYQHLILPVLYPKKFQKSVTPIVLGFALHKNGVRKCSATTDLHGNFKLWMAPGLRGLIRLFRLLDTIALMENVTLTTNNVPILQSTTIRDAED